MFHFQSGSIMENIGESLDKNKPGFNSGMVRLKPMPTLGTEAGWEE
jgi:hypothetical protein